MGHIEIPETLTVSEEEPFNPHDPYGPPVEKIITVNFGHYEVAKYRLRASHVEGFFYYLDADGNRVGYDTPEEFLAQKLKALFRLLDKE